MSLPALEFLRTDYTEIWASTAAVPLLRCSDCTRSIASTGLDSLELGLETRVRAELERFDDIHSWYGSTRPEFRDVVSDLPFTFYAALPPFTGSRHATDFYMEQVRGPAGAVPHIEVGRVIPRDFIAAHPFSGSIEKNWPLERFHALTTQLPYPVEFSAGPEEQLEGAVRFESVWDLACWLATARAYVGNDSGITHLAAAVGVPVIALFRVTDPRVWAPRGRAPVVVLTGDPPITMVSDVVARAADGRPLPHVRY